MCFQLGVTAPKNLIAINFEEVEVRLKGVKSQETSEVEAPRRVVLKVWSIKIAL